MLEQQRQSVNVIQSVDSSLGLSIRKNAQINIGAQNNETQREEAMEIAEEAESSSSPSPQTPLSSSTHHSTTPTPTSAFAMEIIKSEPSKTDFD